MFKGEKNRCQLLGRININIFLQLPGGVWTLTAWSCGPQLSQYACPVLQSQPRKVAFLPFRPGERSFAQAHAVARHRGSCGEYFMAWDMQEFGHTQESLPEDVFQLCCWQFLSKPCIRMCSYSRPASSPSKEGRTSGNSQNWGPDCHLEYR